MNNMTFFYLKVIKTVNYENLNDSDKKKIPEYLIVENIGRIFFTLPMFSPNDLSDNDIVIEVIKDIGEDGHEFPVKDIVLKKEKMILHELYAYVYNCKNVEYSEFGHAVFDDNYEHRMA